MSDTYEEQNKNKTDEEDQKNKENFDETTKLLIIMKKRSLEIV